MMESKFKMTEVGLVPEDWEATKLQDILSIGNGRDYKHLSSGNIPVYGTGGYMTSVSDYLYDGETVCIGRKGTIDVPQYHNGKIWTVDTLFYTHSFTNASAKFIFYAFHMIDWHSLNEATGVPSLTSKNILNTFIPLPPLSEQRKIAAALSDVDKLISSLDMMIAKKRDIKQGAMQQLLTGKKRLPGFNKPWLEKRLGEVADICTGARNGDEQCTEGLYPFFVRSQTVYRINSYSYDGEAIIVPGEGGIGKIFHYINGKFDYHQRVYKISDFPQNINAKFIYYYMTRFFGKYASQNLVKATVDSLRLPMFQQFSMKIPPSLAEQTAIADILTAMDEEISTLEAKRDKYMSIKQGMMQELLTGKTRLV